MSNAQERPLSTGNLSTPRTAERAVQMEVGDLEICSSLDGDTGEQVIGPDGSEPPQPEWVTLCGSMRFLPLILQVAAEETAAGRIVLAPFSVVAPEDQESDFKSMLDALHRHKIDAAARVIVVTDETGYYGASTSAEIEYAHSTGKPVMMRAVATGAGDR